MLSMSSATTSKVESRSYNNVAKDGVNYSEGVFKNVTRNNGLKILYDENVNIASEIAYEDYIGACADRIVGGNIVSTGRAPGGVVVFVNSTDTVNDLCMSGLVINKVLHKVEPLVKPAIRLTISNCPPYIDNAVLKPFIEKHGRIVGPIKVLSANFKRKDLQHILCFRRQVSILPHDRNVDINAKETIVSSGVYHAIFLSSGGMICFKCKAKGHRAAECTNFTTDIVTDSHVTNNTDHRTGNRKTDNPKLVKKSVIEADGVLTPTANLPGNSGGPQATSPAIPTEGNNSVNVDDGPESEILDISSVNTANIDCGERISLNTEQDSVATTTVSPEVATSISAQSPSADDSAAEIVSVVDMPNPAKNSNAVETPNVLTGDDVQMCSDSDLNDDAFVDCSDTMSVCSNVSHVSEVSMDDLFDSSQTQELSQHQGLSLTPPSKKEVYYFFIRVKNSKKQIQECTKFCPDLRLLHNILFSLKDAKILNTNTERTRIRALMNRIKSHIRSNRSRSSVPSFF